MSVLLILKWLAELIATTAEEGAVTETAGSDPRAGLFRVLIYGLVLASSAAQFAIVPVMPTYAHRLGLSGFQQRLVFGIGFGVVWTAGLSWIADTVRAGSGLGGSVASAGVGGVVGPAASGALVQYFGLAIPLLATAAAFAVITIGLGLLRMPARPAAPTAPAAASLRAATSDRNTICAAAAILTAGVTTGVSALLVPVQLRAAGASTGRIGLDFAIAGMLFAIGSALTAFVGRQTLRIPVICGGMFVLAAALSPAALTTAPLAIVAMLCVTTAARSVLWTVGYPLAAEGAQQSGAGLGVVVGLLNGIWAATAVLGPLVAGLAVEHLSTRTVFGLTEAACIAVLAAVVAVAWRTRQPAHCATDTQASPAAQPAAVNIPGDLVPVQRQVYERVRTE